MIHMKCQTLLYMKNKKKKEKKNQMSSAAIVVSALRGLLLYDSTFIKAANQKRYIHYLLVFIPVSSEKFCFKNRSVYIVNVLSMFKSSRYAKSEIQMPVWC